MGSPEVCARVEVELAAHPLDDPDTDFRLHISLGPDF